MHCVNLCHLLSKSLYLRKRFSTILICPTDIAKVKLLLKEWLCLLKYHLFPVSFLQCKMSPGTNGISPAVVLLVPAAIKITITTTSHSGNPFFPVVLLALWQAVFPRPS